MVKAKKTSAASMPVARAGAHCPPSPAASPAALDMSRRCGADRARRPALAYWPYLTVSPPVSLKEAEVATWPRHPLTKQSRASISHIGHARGQNLFIAPG
jgi:hypothetical protein